VRSESWRICWVMRGCRRVQPGHHVAQVPQRPAQPVEAPHHRRVPRPQLLQGRIELRPPIKRPRRPVGPDLPSPRRGQLVDVQVRVLLGRRGGWGSRRCGRASTRRRLAAGWCSPVRGAGPVRAGDHPGPDGGWADGGAGPWPGRGSAVQAVRGAATAGPEDVRGVRAHGRADRRRARDRPHLDLSGTGPHGGAGTPGHARPDRGGRAGGHEGGHGGGTGRALPAVRARGRSRWFVVQADPVDPEHGPVVGKVLVDPST